jgi:hypothetical protein
MLLVPTEKGKHRHRNIARLFLHHAVVDGLAVKARRRTGLETAHRQIQFAQPGRQRNRRGVAEAAGTVAFQPDMDQTVQESTGSQHHRRRLETHTQLRDNPSHAVTADGDVIDRLLEQGEIRLVFQIAANGLTIKRPIGLCAGGAHGRPLRRVEDTELDARHIGSRRHRAPERIHLPDQMPLADAADRGIAGHRAQRFDVVSEQQRLRPGPCRS